MCRFCESYEDHKRHHKEINENNRKAGIPQVYREYGAALVQREWTREKGKAHSSRTTDFRNLYGYQLNFCPECGRRLT